MAARIQVRPAEARAGEAIEVRLLVGHAQENGQRRDARGERVPRNLIKDLQCRYADQVVFRAELGTGIAANPYLVFWMRAVRSDELAMTWVDESGASGSARTNVVVRG